MQPSDQALTDRFDAAATAYQERFGTIPPVNLGCMDIAPAVICDMIERATARGTPITDSDFPEPRTDVLF